MKDGMTINEATSMPASWGEPQWSPPMKDGMTAIAEALTAAGAPAAMEPAHEGRDDAADELLGTAERGRRRNGARP